jgi:hypothetical protein
LVIDLFEIVRSVTHSGLQNRELGREGEGVG